MRGDVVRDVASGLRGFRGLGDARVRHDGQPVAARRLAHAGTHHVLHQPMHPHRLGLTVDQRQPQQLAQRVLQLQLPRLEPAQRADRDRVRGQEGDRLQQFRRPRCAHRQPVERQPPRGGHGAPGALDLAQQQPVAVTAEQAHVVGQRHPRLLDVGARLLERQREVAEQLGQRVRLDGPVPGAGGDVGQRLATGQRPDRDGVGDAPPRRVAGGDDDVAVARRGQERLELRGLVRVVVDEQPARCAVQLGPQRRAGVLARARTARSPAPRPARRARWRCRRGLRRRSTRRPGRAGAAGGPAPAPARSCPPRPAR